MTRRWITAPASGSAVTLRVDLGEQLPRSDPLGKGVDEGLSPAVVAIVVQGLHPGVEFLPPRSVPEGTA